MIVMGQRVDMEGWMMVMEHHGVGEEVHREVDLGVAEAVVTHQKLVMKPAEDMVKKWIMKVMMEVMRVQVMVQKVVMAWLVDMKQNQIMDQSKVGYGSTG